MGHDMKVQLLLSKLQCKNAEQRPLTAAIRHTLQLVARHLNYTNSTLQAEYELALATLAVRSLPLREIVRNLSPNPADQLTQSQVLGNALAAAAHLGLQSDAELFLKTGDVESSQTRFFASLLSAAARAGNGRMLFSLLALTFRDINSSSDRLATWFRVDALNEAVAAGQVEAAQILLDFEIFHGLRPEYESAIKSAIRASHEDLALLLLRHRNSCTTNAPSVDATENERPNDEQFWRELLQIAAARNCFETARFILDTCAIASWKGSFDAPLEEASHCGHTETVTLLVSHFSSCNLTSYTCALFWAARGGHCEILDILLGGVALGDFTGLVDALCGAFYHRKDVVSHILSLWPTDNSLANGLNGLVAMNSFGFAQTVDLLLDAYELFPSVSSRGFS